MPFGLIKKALLRFARKVVEGILGQLTQQLNVVQEQAYKPMEVMIQQVTGGVWRGNGADAFVEEVSSLFMPGVSQIADQIMGVNQNLQFAVDVIDRADEQVNQVVNGLGDIFGSIY